MAVAAMRAAITIFTAMSPNEGADPKASPETPAPEQGAIRRHLVDTPPWSMWRVFAHLTKTQGSRADGTRAPPRAQTPAPSGSRRAIIWSKFDHTPSTPCHCPLVAALEYSVERASKKLACSTPDTMD